MKAQQNWAVAIAMQCGVVPHVFGMPGVAKTACFRALSKASQRRFLQVILRQKMPEDIGGVPVPSDIDIQYGTCDSCEGIGYLASDGVQTDGNTCITCRGSGKLTGTVRGVVNLLSEEMLRARNEPSIVLLDEFNQSGHDVMGAAQEWINNPPENCWMAACSNPVEQSTSGIELSPPVVNRMCTLEWETPVDAILTGWRNGFRDYPEPDFPIVPSDYLEKYGAHWGETLCEYHASFPDAFESYPTDANKACDPWCSWRSGTNAGKLLAACDAVWASAATRAKLVFGCMGQGRGNELLQFIGQNDLPNPEDLLNRPDQLVLPARFDLVRTILGGVIGAVKSSGSGERWERGYDVLEVAFQQNPEAGMSAEGALWKAKPEGYEPQHRNGVAKEMREARVGE